MGPWELDSRPFSAEIQKILKIWKCAEFEYDPHLNLVLELENSEICQKNGLFLNCSETGGTFINFGNLFGIDSSDQFTRAHRCCTDPQQKVLKITKIRVDFFCLNQKAIFTRPSTKTMQYFTILHLQVALHTCVCQMLHILY